MIGVCIGAKRRAIGFARHEDGAITVDWIVLTAALVMMAMAIAFVVGANIPGLADAVADHMENTEVGA